MDNPKHQPHVRPARQFMQMLDRRDGGRQEFLGHVHLIWHHDPDRMCSFEVLDVSSTGARLRVGVSLLEGMTGVVVTLDPGKVEVNRACMVVWSRSIRDPDGHITHHEAGIRFL
jgi:hypothetical protein